MIDDAHKSAVAVRRAECDIDENGRVSVTATSVRRGFTTSGAGGTAGGIAPHVHRSGKLMYIELAVEYRKMRQRSLAVGCSAIHNLWLWWHIAGALHDCDRPAHQATSL